MADTDILDRLKHRELDGTATLGELAAIDEIERLRSTTPQPLSREEMATHRFYSGVEFFHGGIRFEPGTYEIYKVDDADQKGGF